MAGESPPTTTSTVVVDVLAGHLGHLTDAQQLALTTFKNNLTQAGLYNPPPASSEHLSTVGENGGHVDHAGFEGMTHDDPTLLRFLRARRFDTVKAQKQFSDAETWRKKHDVDGLFAQFPEEEFESAKRFYPRWTGRRDINGLPVYVYRLASLAPIQKELNQVPSERRYQRIVALYEVMTRFVLPFCSSLPHTSSSPFSSSSLSPTPPTSTPISSVTTIIDLDSVSFSSMWSLRHHLQEASVLATANYPETLNTIAVVNSPSFFPTIWGWIKGWFDEGTRNKIHILGKDPGPTLVTIVDVEDLPRTYGGKLEWKFEDPPSLDGKAKEALGMEEMPKGPVVWEDGKVRWPRKG